MKKNIILHLMLINVGLFFTLFFPISVRADTRFYVGVETCKMCHEKQYKVWEFSAHANAYNNLNESQKNDAKCLKCHTTDGTAKFANVQCEACHGPGSDYVNLDVMKDFNKVWDAGLNRNAAKTCLYCHNESCSKFQGFDFKVYWMEIMH